MSISDIDSLCQHYLDLIYQTTQTPIATDVAWYDKQHHGLAENNKTETQGEILYPSINKLLSIIPLTPNDTFADLGSGSGKIVAQVFLKSQVKEALGIEIIPFLHQQALKVAQRIREDLPHFYSGGRQLSFELGNFIEQPDLLANTTVVLINATCFSQKLLSPLGEIINSLPNIHTVMTLRPFFNLHRLRFKQAISIECSWDSALCYLYQ